MEKLLMLGTSLASREMVEYARSQGMRTVVTDYLPPERSTAKLVADEWWMINTGDLDALEERCRSEGVTSVACGVSEFNLEVAMELSRRLGLSCYCTPEAWHFSRDKSDFKRLCREQGVPVPEDYCLTEELLDSDLDAVRYPVVVKPVDMSGNRGISYCHDREELVEAYRYARSVSKSPKVVVERMLKGREWYAYYVLADGVASQVCLNAMEAEPGELKNLYSLTTSVAGCVERFMEEINPKIERLLGAVGCREGIAWVQVMLDEDDRFYVIEMGYRLPGDMPFVAYPHLFGFDSVKWIVDCARGIRHDPSELPPAQKGPYSACGCGYSLWTKRAGVIGRMGGISEALEIPGVSFHSLYQVGDSFAAHRPVGVFGVSADGIGDFCEKLRRINELVTVEDADGEDVLIRYTDFAHLVETYGDGCQARS